MRQGKRWISTNVYCTALQIICRYNDEIYQVTIGRAWSKCGSNGSDWRQRCRTFVFCCHSVNFLLPSQCAYLLLRHQVDITQHSYIGTFSSGKNVRHTLPCTSFGLHTNAIINCKLIMTQFNDNFCTQFPPLGGAGYDSIDEHSCYLRVTRHQSECNFQHTVQQQQQQQQKQPQQQQH